jgi:hypothetical protein
VYGTFLNKAEVKVNGQAANVAAGILILTSDAASWITGTWCPWTAA